MKPQEFMDCLHGEIEQQIYEVVDHNLAPENDENQREIPPIIVSFYGKTVEIDSHADNFEALIGFLRQVIKNK